MNDRLTILQGDWIEQLRTLPDESVQCCVTSPPYWGLRDYGVAGQLGLEKAPEEYVAKLVAGFREVRRVLRKDGTLWLNLGDSYCATTKGSGGHNPKQDSNRGSWMGDRSWQIPTGLKSKDLVGIPYRVAFALQADGWYLRSHMPWIKRNCMPESVTDRPASAVESMFLLTKSQRYHCDMKAVEVPASAAYMNDGRWKSGPTDANVKLGYEDAGTRNPKATHKVFNGEKRTTRNRRNSDWFFESWQGLYQEDGEPLAFIANTAGFNEAHFATFPSKLIEPCILAGTKAGDTVLDPFGGSGTTGMVANTHARKAILIELNPQYI